MSIERICIVLLLRDEILLWQREEVRLFSARFRQEDRKLILWNMEKLEMALSLTFPFSTGVFIGVDEDKSGILAAIEEKIAKATRIPISHYESFNILRYQLGQKYDSHYDAFNPAEYGPQKSQRLVSFLLYLSSVEEGGETMFPFEVQNGKDMNGSYGYQKCIGLKVKPRQGDAIFFYNLFPNGTIDQASVSDNKKQFRTYCRPLHGSCPVMKGEKWVATKWIRDQPYEDYAD
ncbi:unnamed protein product [Arabis nemorensis]|uniref:Fe2OG dioxygenase domain-containing protein n=1 Tax=Arabis nemorensis TaxID=586526 RepID=A0A565C546_9BRAS|nr:unnamed protein product [Arabis nemorensis]